MDVCANRASVVDNRSAEVAAAEGKQATEAATEFAKVRAAEKAALIQAQAAAEVQQVIDTARAERAQLRQTRELQLTRVFMSRGRFVGVLAECYIHWCRVWASNRIFRKGAWENDAAKEKRALEQQEQGRMAAEAVSRSQKEAQQHRMAAEAISRSQKEAQQAREAKREAAQRALKEKARKNAAAAQVMNNAS